MNELQILKNNLEMIKNDLQNQNVDLFVAKMDLQTIVSKAEKLVKDNNSPETVEFLNTARKLLDEVSYNITALTAEEFFNSHNDEI